MSNRYDNKTILIFAENISDNYHNFVEDIWDSFGSDDGMEYPDDIPKSAANYFNDYRPRMDAEDIIIARPPVMCKPMPGRCSDNGSSVRNYKAGNGDVLIVRLL